MSGLTRLWPIFFLMLTASLAKAEPSVTFALDDGRNLSTAELYSAGFPVGEVLQVSNGRGRTYDVTIVRSTLS